MTKNLAKRLLWQLIEFLLLYRPRTHSLETRKHYIDVFDYYRPLIQQGIVYCE
jgi:hypothetical protein